MADISKIQLPSGVTYNIKDKTSGYITTETDPVFSASAASTITTSDINNWKNANGLAWNSSSKELRVSKSGTATTVLSQSDMRYDSTSNTTGFLTLADLPIYDGTVTTP